MTKPRIIAVLGMHRSGTSAIARGLKVLGVDLGDNLAPAIKGENDKGFWEDVDISKINRRVLQSIGGDWSTLSAESTEPLLGDQLAKERNEATALLSKKIANSSVFGFKDPRTCLIMPFWRCVFDDLGIEDNYLIALRNPLEVANSLQSRNSFDPTLGQLLWLKYTWAAIRDTTGKRRLCISYSNMLSSPSEQLTRIASAFELPGLSHTSNAFIEYASDFLSTDLRHYHISSNELKRSKRVISVIPEIYGELSRWANAPPHQDLDVPPELKTQIERFFEESDPLFAFADRLSAELSECSNKLTQTEKLKLGLMTQVDDLRQDSAQLQQTLVKSTTEVKEFSSKLCEQQKVISNLEAQLREAQSASSDASSQLKAEVGRTAELQTQLVALEQQKKSVDVRLGEELKKLAERDQTIRHLKTASEHLQDQLKNACKELVATQTERQQETKKAETLAARIAALETEKASAEKRLAETAARLGEELKKLAERDQTILAFEESQAEAHHILQLQILANETKDNRIAGLQSELAQLEIAAKVSEQAAISQHAEDEARLAALAKEIGEQKSTSSALRAAEQQAKSLIATQDKQLTELTSTNDRLEQDLATAVTRCSEMQTSIAELTRDLRLARHEAFGLRTSLAESMTAANSQITEAATQLQELVELKQVCISKLQNEVDEKSQTVQTLRNVVLELQASTSWRVTKPLRQARTLLTSLRRKPIRRVTNGQELTGADGD